MKKQRNPVAVAMRKRYGQTTTTHADKREKQAPDWAAEATEELRSCKCLCNSCGEGMHSCCDYYVCNLPTV